MLNCYWLQYLFLCSFYSAVRMYDNPIYGFYPSVICTDLLIYSCYAHLVKNERVHHCGVTIDEACFFLVRGFTIICLGFWFHSWACTIPFNINIHHLSRSLGACSHFFLLLSKRVRLSGLVTYNLANWTDYRCSNGNRREVFPRSTLYV